MKRILIIMVIAITAVSCTNDNSQSYTTHLLFNTDTTVFQDTNALVSHFQYNYLTYSGNQAKEVNSLHYILGGDHLFTYDLDQSESTISSLPPTEGPTMQSLLIDEKDTLLLRMNGKLYRKQVGQFVLDKDFNQTPMIQSDGLKIPSSLGFNRGMHRINDSTILIPISSNYKGTGKYGDPRKRFPFFAKYNLNTRSYDYLYYLAPKHFLKGSHYILNVVQSSTKGDTLFVSYPYNEEIDLYSISKNKLISTVSLKSFYHTQEIQEISNKDIDDKRVSNSYRIENGSYSSFIYNPYTDLYYRVFYHFLPTKNEKGEFSIFSDKSSSIAVYDSNFEFQGEHLFEKGFFHFMAIVSTKNGVIIKSYYDTENNKMHLINLKHEWKK